MTNQHQTDKEICAEILSREESLKEEIKGWKFRERAASAELHRAIREIQTRREEFARINKARFLLENKITKVEEGKKAEREKTISSAPLPLPLKRYLASLSKEEFEATVLYAREEIENA